MKNRTWGYVRCSTNKQELSTQIQNLTDYSSAYKFEIDNLITDFGVSGSTFNRDGMNELKEGIENGSFNQLLIYSISRLGRSMVETITLLNKMESLGINVISLKENLNMGTPSGKMVASILSVLSEYELELVKQRTSDSLQSKKSNGIKYTREVFGFDMVKGSMIVNPYEQKLIRKMFNMRNKGYGFTEISNHLNKNNHKNKSGGSFSRSYIYKIIQNKQKITDKNHRFFVERTPNYV